MDGNYSGTLAVRLAACDTVIFLDLPRTLCVWRVSKRVLMCRRERRPDLGEGCPERFSLEFIRWVWGYPGRTKPRVFRLLAEHAPGKQIIRLCSRAEVREFLDGIQA